MSKSMKLVLLGPPGSGKSTIAKEITKKYSIPDFYMGEILREEVKKNTTVGKEISKYIDKGELVPGNFVSDLIYLLIHNKSKYLLDGFPRSIQQAEYIHHLGIKVNCVLMLEVPEKEVVIRLSLRRVCLKCRTQYHLKFFPPKNKDTCNTCQSKIIQRKDDKPQVIKERFRVYHQETEKLIKFYLDNHVLFKIDASKTPKEVIKNSLKTLDKVFSK